MKIPLNQFEQYIDETILKRGLQYFKNGQVNEPEEISPGEYVAIVEVPRIIQFNLSSKTELLPSMIAIAPTIWGLFASI